MSNPYLKKAEEIRKAIDTFAENQTDETLLDNKAAFEFWNPSGVEYAAGKIVQDDDKLYKCIQPHKSQSDWKPNRVPALFTRITATDWEEWGDKQSYAKGAKVTHNDKKWISNVDNNIWEPGATGVYTWDEYVGGGNE